MTAGPNILARFAALWRLAGGDVRMMPATPTALYDGFRALGADSTILAIVGSWGDTQSDADLAAMIDETIAWYRANGYRSVMAGD